jgi:hypothetical protein
MASRCSAYGMSLQCMLLFIKFVAVHLRQSRHYDSLLPPLSGVSDMQDGMLGEPGADDDAPELALGAKKKKKKKSRVISLTTLPIYFTMGKLHAFNVRVTCNTVRSTHVSKGPTDCVCPSCAANDLCVKIVRFHIQTSQDR